MHEHNIDTKVKSLTPFMEQKMLYLIKNPTILGDKYRRRDDFNRYKRRNY